jgi:CxxC motif-containing protein (DUF1111 family)
MNKLSTVRRINHKHTAFAAHAGFAVVVTGAIAAGCSGAPEPFGSAGGPSESNGEWVGTSTQAVTAAGDVVSAQTSSTGSTNGDLAILVSGTITGNNGQPLPGITVMLAGQVGPQSTPTSLPTTTTTNALGYYSFAVDAPGNGAGGGTVTVSITPTQSGTTFSLAQAVDGNPVGSTSANLANIGANTTVNFNANVAGTAVTVAVDPGVRTGAPGAGPSTALSTTNPTCVPGQSGNDCPLPNASACFPGLSAANLAFCLGAMVRFQEVDSVSGTDVDGPNGGAGLGPTFNGNSCAQCHAQPSPLGSSPGLTSPQRPIGNPQVGLATLDGASNSLSVLPFISFTGPMREVRFASDSGVHDILSIAGRNDAPGCTAAIEPQPAAAAGATASNPTAGGTISFRIPTPTFGLGLVENVTDNALRSNLDATPTLGGVTGPTASSLGITGSLQTSGNDGTVTRFGWKAQNKSLLIFSGEAYNVEMGVTNENFQNERAVDSTACVFNGGPEDVTNTIGPISGTTTGTASDMSSDITDFSAAMRLSAPPAPATAPFVAGGTTITATEVATGQSEFITVGCGNCHSPTLTTETSGVDPAMNNVTFHPFSDFAIHNMGTGLADVATQGAAGPQQFRSAPLWGVGQRVFLLHDGRTTSLVAAIQAHSSSGSEANTVITRFNALSVTNQQAIVDFLRSL